MNLIKKTKLAKTELHIFTLLEETNREFTAAWESCQDPSKKSHGFQNCVQQYKKIMELITHNRKSNNISDLLESYYLEAWLSYVQSQLNDLPQDPFNEDVVLSNDEMITKLTQSLNDLNQQVNILNLHNKKNIDKALRKDYRDLFDRISQCFSSWDQTISQRKAAYYYNVAEKLITESKRLSVNYHDYDLKKNLLSTSILCLENAKGFYLDYGQQQYANETSHYRRNIEKKLKQLDEEQARLKAPPKPTLKRKNLIISDEKKPISKKPKSKMASHQVHKKKRTNLTNNEKMNIPSVILLKSKQEEEILQKEKEILQKEAEFNKMLKQTVINEDPFRFYGQLFLSLSQTLVVYSKESSNHFLLTQLSWLTIAKQLMNLIPNKNQTDNAFLKRISSHKKELSCKHKKTLVTISSQKRDVAYPIYGLNDLQPANLQNLLIKEIFDYYYGLEAFMLTSAATQFLDSITSVLNPYSFVNTLNYVMQPMHEQSVNLIFAKILRELIKFHVCDENANWRNDIFSTTAQINLNKEYLRILSISERFVEGSSKENQALSYKIQQLKRHLLQQIPQQASEQNLIFFHNNVSSSFFQQDKQIEPLSIKLLNNILQEHFQHLLQYKISGIKPETIYKHLSGFIKTHCKDQIELNYSRTSQLQTIHF